MCSYILLFLFYCYFEYIDHSRGKKLLRLARRVSGLLMQLTVFEIATPAHLKPPETLTEKQVRLNKDTKVAIPREKNDSELNEKSADVEAGFAEFRTAKSRVDYREAPTLRILGYDPRSKRKSVFIAVPQAVKEVAGGGYSPYLDDSHRRELARIVCEALLLYFPRGKPFELSLPWSGATQEVTNAMAGGEKNSWRSSADRTNKRPGKIFRSALRVNALELVVTIYSQTTMKAIAPTEGAEAISGGTNADGGEDGEGAAPGTKYIELKQIIANFYSVAASEAYELLVTEDEQIARVKRPIMSFEEGVIRAAAIRRLCKFFEAKLIEDPTDDKKKILDCKLLGPGRDFVTEYQMIKPNQNPGDDVRPVGVPSVFLPLDTCGIQLYRQGISRQVDPAEASSLETRRKKNKNSDKDFIISIYTKSEAEGPERGLVVKIYEKETSFTVILHIGPSELIRLTAKEGEYELLRNMVRARETSEEYILDEIETKFTALTDKGEELNKVNKFQQVLFNILINEIGMRMDAENKLTAYIKSAPRGVPPA